MKILVCVKQVPDLEQIVVTEDVDGGAVLGEIRAFRMNRFDEFAVEEAVCIKASLPAVNVDALTVGPEEMLAAVKRAIGMGADRGIHIATADCETIGSVGVAKKVAGYAREKAYDLILTGSMSEDRLNGEVGPMVAGCLGLPCATQVIAMKFTEEPSALDIEREVEGGVRERLRLELPAVISVQSGINRPRYPSLSNLLRANRQPVETIADEGREKIADPVVCRGIVLPLSVREGRVLSGTAQEKARQFLTILKEKAFIRLSSSK